MGKTSKNSARQDYRITVIFKDEIVTEKFNNKNLAIDTIIEMRKLFPNVFMSGALEERRKRWEVVWVLGCND